MALAACFGYCTNDVWTRGSWGLEMPPPVASGGAAQRLFRHRQPRPGPELDLLNGALESGLPTGHRGTPITLREPELPSGSPDFIALYARDEVSPRAPLLHHHLQVLHQLWVCRGTREDSLSKMLNIGRRRLERILCDLVEAGVIRKRGDFCEARSLTSIFGVRQIVAVEAKMSDWKTAIQQAQNNLWFASESYVLIPERRDLSAMIDSAARVGVGLLVYTGQNVRRVTRARRYPIPSSYGSWLFSEWLHHRKYIA